MASSTGIQKRSACSTDVLGIAKKPKLDLQAQRIVNILDMHRPSLATQQQLTNEKELSKQLKNKLSTEKVQSRQLQNQLTQIEKTHKDLIKAHNEAQAQVADLEKTLKKEKANRASAENQAKGDRERAEWYLDEMTSIEDIAKEVESELKRERDAIGVQLKKEEVSHGHTKKLCEDIYGILIHEIRKQHEDQPDTLENVLDAVDKAYGKHVRELKSADWLKNLPETFFTASMK